MNGKEKKLVKKAVKANLLAGIWSLLILLNINMITGIVSFPFLLIAATILLAYRDR